MIGSLSNYEATIVVGLLVERLGGEVTLTAEQVRRVDDLEVESYFDPMTMKTTVRARRKPPTIQGEIVTAEPQSIEPPESLMIRQAKHQHESWQIRRSPDGARYCAACGATL